MNIDEQRQALREGLENLSTFDDSTCHVRRCLEFDDNCRVCRRTQVLAYLHSQGLVFKTGVIVGNETDLTVDVTAQGYKPPEPWYYATAPIIEEP